MTVEHRRQNRAETRFLYSYFAFIYAMQISEMHTSPFEWPLENR
jgi:hypothetical protein